MTRRQRIALLIEKRRVFSRVRRFRNGRTYHYRVKHFRTERCEDDARTTFVQREWNRLTQELAERVVTVTR